MKNQSRIQLLFLIALVLALGQPANARVVAFDTRHSKMTVYVYKQGIFAFAADNHEVNAPIVSGSLEGEAQTVELTVDASKMQVLDPQLPSAKRDKVQANMIGPQVLDVEKYPKISFRSTKIQLDNSNHWTVAGDLTLHGQTHPITIQVVKVDAAHFSGSTMIRQTTFGITPIKIAGGIVRVKDDVKVVFEIALE